MSLPIDVIIPAWGEPYVANLAAAIDSAKAAATITVVGDAHAHAIARASGATRLLDLPAKHPGPARNIALDTTPQPFVLFMDADDMLLPGALEKLHTTLTKHPRSVAAFGYFKRRHNGTFWPAPRLARLAASPIGAYALLYKNCLPAHGSILIRKANLKPGFMFQPVINEDWHAALHIRLSGRVHLMETAIYDYNTAEGSMSRSKRDTAKIIESSRGLVTSAETALGRHAPLLRLADRFLAPRRLRRSLGHAAAYNTKSDQQAVVEIEYE